MWQMYSCKSLWTKGSTKFKCRCEWKISYIHNRDNFNVLFFFYPYQIVLACGYQPPTRSMHYSLDPFVIFLFVFFSLSKSAPNINGVYSGPGHTLQPSLVETHSIVFVWYCWQTNKPPRKQIHVYVFCYFWWHINSFFQPFIYFFNYFWF